MTTEHDVANIEERLRELLHGDDVEAARAVLKTMHPADQPTSFDALEDDERGTMLALLTAEIARL
jgi:Mg/Co/Ni transporter MgtE